MNVVLMLADDAGFECFAPYGSRQYSTPSLGRLAEEGVRFTHCYSTPLCTPTRVALMTGQSGVRNYTDFGALAPSQYTFGSLFRDAGYATAIAGKWQLQGSSNAKGTVPPEAGFETYCLWNAPLTGPERYWKPSINCNGKLLGGLQHSYGPDVFAEFLIDFMETKRNRPFLAYFPMVLPHSPFVPTPDSKDRDSTDRQKNFEDMVAYADKNAGRLLDAIDRLGLQDNTLVLFTSDNGTEHTIRSQLGARSIRGGKGCPTNAGTHVPLIIRGPGVGRGGRVFDELVDPTDFLPTLADAIGARAPQSAAIDGQSFWPQLTGERGRPREWIYSYYFPRPYAKAYDTPYTHPEIHYARDHRFKLYSDGRFFDATADPEEVQPLPASPGPAAAMARRKLQSAIDGMPAHGRLIPREHWKRAQGVKAPVWG
jgi:arylsulfatase A